VTKTKRNPATLALANEPGALAEAPVDSTASDIPFLPVIRPKAGTNTKQQKAELDMLNAC
jgi:hypothetical protein